MSLSFEAVLFGGNHGFVTINIIQLALIRLSGAQISSYKYITISNSNPNLDHHTQQQHIGNTIHHRNSYTALNQIQSVSNAICTAIDTIQIY